MQLIARFELWERQEQRAKEVRWHMRAAVICGDEPYALGFRPELRVASPGTQQEQFDYQTWVLTMFFVMACVCQIGWTLLLNWSAPYPETTKPYQCVNTDGTAMKCRPGI